MNLSDRKRKLILLTAGLFVGSGMGIILLLVFSINQRASAGSGLRAGAAVPAPSVGLPAPYFELGTLDGGTASTSELLGRPVLINFWATWCAPCRLEMPLFQELYEADPDGLAILAVNYAEQPGIVRQYVDELGLTFPILMDVDSEVQRLYHVRGYPTTLLIDTEGIIQVYHVGLMTEKQLSNYLKNLGEVND
jgi:thiol-disulfide isomerase/thioredoxin